MPRNKIEDLRNLLFETLESLNDKDDPMDLGRADAVAKVSQVLINSAKVEIDFIKAIGGDTSTGFISSNKLLN